jgi:hypothetical protein
VGEIKTTVSSERKRPEKKVLTAGAHLSARGRGVQGYRFGCARCWASGLFFGWAESVPAAFYPFFLISFLLFYFLKSDLFPNLLRIVSIQNKQIPSAFK